MQAGSRQASGGQTCREGSGGQQAEPERAVHPHGKGGQQHPRLHEEEHGQQFSGKGLFPLYSTLFRLYLLYYLKFSSTLQYEKGINKLERAQQRTTNMVGPGALAFSGRNWASSAWRRGGFGWTQQQSLSAYEEAIDGPRLSTAVHGRRMGDNRHYSKEVRFRLHRTKSFTTMRTDGHWPVFSRKTVPSTCGGFQDLNKQSSVLWTGDL